MYSTDRRRCPPAPPPRTRTSGCFRPDRPPRLPDPGIYSQQKRFEAGLDLTFQNPDISQSVNILPAPNGEVEVNRRRLTVHATNFSNDAPAAGVLVGLRSTDWGIGLPHTVIGSFSLNLGLGNGPNARANKTMDLPLEVPHGVYYVQVVHPKDRNTTNNGGIEAQQRRNIPSGPFSLDFLVGNPFQRPINIEMAILAQQWSASLEPAALALIPGQVQNVSLVGVADVSTMTPSDRVVLTVIATVDGVFFGGLTYRLGPSAGS